MATAIHYLEQAVAELRAERDELNRQIAVLERSIGDLRGESRAAAPPIPSEEAFGVRTSVQMAPSVRDIALSLIERLRERGGGIMTLADVVAACKEAGNDAQYASVSSGLSKLAKEGFLTKGPRRGTYIVAGSQDLDGPAEAGPSSNGNHSAATTADSQRKEVVGSDGVPADRDRHPAPVMGPS